MGTVGAFGSRQRRDRNGGIGQHGISSLWLAVAFGLITSSATQAIASGQDAGLALRLVPFPKEVQLTGARFRLDKSSALTVPDTPIASTIGKDFVDEAAGTWKRDVRLAARPADGKWRCSLSAKPVDAGRFDRLAAPADHAEGYVLTISDDAALIVAATEPGLAHGIQTLRQLIRANTKDDAIPCLRIRDWPTMRYRGYSDDITRGPSPKLAFIEDELRQTAFLKMNFWTYYMEYQYAFKKHPLIGPPDGSLTPDELRALVALGNRYGVEIIGNQQSFGHFGRILGLDRYKSLRETPDVLNPTNEETYRLLDDFYSEVAPLLESKLFNVCCDETWGLGTGPSKPVAEKIGVGAVYANHLRRLHDLLADKYGKRMMMWGDIIIKHPEHLPKIPKDTIVLSWGYHDAASFDDAITPFSKSGYEFFVCPGVSCWSRILPDFGVAVTNIRNYVRDGAKHGALGMLNTTWDDDGENFFAWNWHGLAWGAECAWNASTTPYEDFSRRIGGVLFGEPGDHFGKAIDLLSKAHRLPGYDHMLDRRFWKEEFGNLPVDERSTRRQAEALLAITRPALEHLRACKEAARVNAEWLDVFVFGAERMQFMATRVLDYLDAAKAYEVAVADETKRAESLELARRKLGEIRDDHADLRRRYTELWNRENKPYALDWVDKRFAAMPARYDAMLTKLDRAIKQFEEKGALPSAEEAGLATVELGARRTRPARVKLVSRESVPADISRVSAFGAEGVLGWMVLHSGTVNRIDLPIELDLPKELRSAAPLTVLTASGATLPCQIASTDTHGRLECILLGEFLKAADCRLILARPASGTEPKLRAVRCGAGPGGATWIENDHFKLLVGPEGAHIYRWEIKALGNRDVTHPGESGWSGFADVGGPHRGGKNRIEVLAGGPAMVRLRCTDETGLEKTMTAYAGVPWIEVTLDQAVDYFWNFTDARLMAADSDTPGTYLFADGSTGKVRALTGSTDCQAAGRNVRWSAKFVKGGPLIAMITPEVATRHVIGPGGGMGGVGIERGVPAAHFVIHAGSCPESPKETLDALCATLDFRNQPTVDVHAVRE
ncbi:MAG: family 20 glycosylhydrolase [Phycisphaerae bacterium]|nr:family 20 glycosylhydrolase [Phycisphaerae bacterium]